LKYLGEKNRHGVATCVPLHLRLLRTILLHPLPRHRGQHVHRIGSVFYIYSNKYVFEEINFAALFAKLGDFPDENAERALKWNCKKISDKWGKIHAVNR
jgi:hypothetical protein